MYKTTYTKETYVIRDNRGNYLKEGSDDPDAPIFIDNETRARHWYSATPAQGYADYINERYIAGDITDVWGVPKRVLVHKMTVSIVVEPMPAPNQTKMNI